MHIFPRQFNGIKLARSGLVWKLSSKKRWKLEWQFQLSLFSSCSSILHSPEGLQPRSDRTQWALRRGWGGRAVLWAPAWRQWRAGSRLRELRDVYHSRVPTECWKVEVESHLGEWSPGVDVIDKFQSSLTTLFWFSAILLAKNNHRYWLKSVVTWNVQSECFISDYSCNSTITLVDDVNSWFY